MATVNISVDTNTRQAALTVDGQIVPAVACHLSKGVDFEGTPFLRLSYVLEAQDQNGLSQRTEFFLPDPEDDGVFAVDQNGLSSRAVESKKTTTSVQQDIINYYTKRK